MNICKTSKKGLYYWQRKIGQFRLINCIKGIYSVIKKLFAKKKKPNIWASFFGGELQYYKSVIYIKITECFYCYT